MVVFLQLTWVESRLSLVKGSLNFSSAAGVLVKRVGKCQLTGSKDGLFQCTPAVVTRTRGKALLHTPGCVAVRHSYLGA